MNQTEMELNVYAAFLRGAGQHLTFYECVSDLIEKGGTIDDVAALVRNAKEGENDRISFRKAVMDDV